jgi:hypothetical protein
LFRQNVVFDALRWLLVFDIVLLFFFFLGHGCDLMMRCAEARSREEQRMTKYIQSGGGNCIGIELYVR